MVPGHRFPQRRQRPRHHHRHVGSGGLRLQQPDVDDRSAPVRQQPGWHDRRERMADRAVSRGVRSLHRFRRRRRAQPVGRRQRRRWRPRQPGYFPVFSPGLPHRLRRGGHQPHHGHQRLPGCAGAAAGRLPSTLCPEHAGLAGGRQRPDPGPERRARRRGYHTAAVPGRPQHHLARAGGGIWHRGPGRRSV